MGERGVILRPHEVRAVLDGRQTQFRRVVKWPLMSHSDGAKRRIFGADDVAEVNRLLASPGRHPCWRIASPYGAPGDLLWVRETWQYVYDHKGLECVCYRADGQVREAAPCLSVMTDWPSDTPRMVPRWRPSIHMPRWASRLTLRVTEVRVERLQSLTEADAEAEGMTLDTVAGWPLRVTHPDGRVVHGEMGWSTPSYAFAAVWDTTSGKRPGCAWTDNPWVFVVSFEVCQ